MMQCLSLSGHQRINMCLNAVQQTEELSVDLPVDSTYWQAMTHADT